MVLIVTGQALADSMIAPNLPHYLFNGIPFASNSGETRYQQVYDSSIFTSPIYIKSLAFSPSISDTYTANVRIGLGYTLNEPGALSPDLASNVLGSLTSVFHASHFSQSITGGSETFSLVFSFPCSPFLYDPTWGNLLLDIRISNQDSDAFFSRFPVGSGLSSRAYDSEYFGNGTSDAGLRTLVGFTPVPEPTTMLLLASGLIGLVGYGRKKLFKR
jgi:hypothetical protein